MTSSGPTRYSSIFVLAAATLAIFITSGANPITAKEPVPMKPVRKPVQLPGMVVDFEKRCVDIEGTIRVKDGLLELVACTKDTKEHESIVAVAARPMHIHTALLLLGANNGHPAMRKRVDEELTRWVNLPPHGDPVVVFLVVNNTDGEPVERPISDFVVRSKERIDEVDGDVLIAPEPEGRPDDEEVVRLPHTFLFTGSRLLDNGEGPRRYLADQSGDVISIATFGDEVLSLPFHQSQANGALKWRADPKALPEVGTKVTLRLRPQAKAKHPMNANSAANTIPSKK